MSDMAHNRLSSAPGTFVPSAIKEWLGLGLRSKATIGRDVQLLGRIWVHGGGKVDIRDRVRIDATDLPVELHAEPQARIVIGEGASIAGGSSIEATALVVIGSGVRMGRLCKVLDNSFHETRGDRYRRPPSRPVEIGAGALIGDRAILLPGAHVKPGQVVLPGEVVRGLKRRTADQAVSADQAATDVIEHAKKHSLLEMLLDPFGSLEALISRWRAWLLFRREERSPGIRVRGSLQVERGGTLRIGPRVTFLRGMIPALLAARPGAVLDIGEGSSLNYGVTLDASVGITLGAGCQLGSMVVLRDDDGEMRAPIVLGDRVWLAHGVIVKPGVRIGSDAVVSAGSVVVKDVPDGAFAAGNPARSGMARTL